LIDCCVAVLGRSRTEADAFMAACGSALILALVGLRCCVNTPVFWDNYKYGIVRCKTLNLALKISWQWNDKDKFLFPIQNHSNDETFSKIDERQLQINKRNFFQEFESMDALLAISLEEFGYSN
jgi:hypothetical protein